MFRRNGFLAGSIALAFLAQAILCLPSLAQGQPPQPVRYTYSISVQGMTCQEGCATTVQQQLARMPGVVQAKVDYQNGQPLGYAWVTVESPRGPLTAEQLRQTGGQLAAAVSRAGDDRPQPFTPTVNYLLTIQGMHCQACAQKIEETLRQLPGVAAASVVFQGGYAVVVPAAQAPDLSQSLLNTIGNAGYQAAVHTRP